jgi:hypothetical protein
MTTNARLFIAACCWPVSLAQAAVLAPPEQWRFPISSIYQSDFGYGGAVQTGDGGCVAVYSHEAFYTGVTVTKLQTNGSFAWGKCLQPKWESEVNVRMAGTQDGGALLALTCDRNEIFEGTCSLSRTSGPIVTNLPSQALDAWLARLDMNGNKLWDRTLGGTGDDEVQAIQQTPDGGFILLTTSDSAQNGTKGEAGHGGEDLWLTRLDAHGRTLWDHAYGGSGLERKGVLAQTPDGGFVVAAWSSSPASGSKTAGSFGGDDVWIFCTDASGNKLWDRTYGGSAEDYVYGLGLLTSGGLALVVDSLSGVSGNKTSPAGTGLWVMRLDTNGLKTADYTLNATLAFWIPTRVTTDNGLMLSGLNAQGNPVVMRFSGTDTNATWVLPTAPGDSTKVRALTSDGGFLCELEFGSVSATNWFLRKMAPDALIARPLVRATRSGTNALAVALTGSSNHLYALDHSPNAQQWTPLITNLLISNQMTVTIEATNTASFFKARLVP